MAQFRSDTDPHTQLYFPLVCDTSLIWGEKAPLETVWKIFVLKSYLAGETVGESFLFSY